MKSLKTIFALILALALILSHLIACNQIGQTEESILDNIETDSSSGPEEVTTNLGETPLDVTTVPDATTTSNNTTIPHATTTTEAITHSEVTISPKATTASDITTAENLLVTEPPHTHSFASVWSTSATQHWHECECGEKNDIAEHVWNAWTIIKEPSCTNNGQKTRTCTVCDAKETSDIAALGHNYIDTIISPTATVDGYTEHKCSRCNDSYIDSVIKATGSIGLAYKDNGYGSCTITGMGTCTDTEIYIPLKINDLDVAVIGDKAFENQTSITSVHIPDYVITIGREAFSGCTNLKEINIPASVKIIGSTPFLNSGLESVVYSTNKIEKFDYSTTNTSVFSGAPLKKIVFDVVEVPSGVCYGCTSLNEIVFSDKVKVIGGNVFRGCSSLTNFSIPEGITSIGGWAFCDCVNLQSVTIPTSVDFIGSGAFSDTSLIAINYSGTIEQWNSIRLTIIPPPWCAGLSDCIIHCIDGDVTP